MKNILGVMALVSASMVAAGDTAFKSGVHALAVSEALMQKYRIPASYSYSFEKEPEMQRMLDEARKNCQTCLFLEFIKRTTAKNPFIKISNPIITQQDGTTTGMGQYYAQNCPADIYQKLSDDVLLGLVTSDSSKVQ